MLSEDNVSNMICVYFAILCASVVVFIVCFLSKIQFDIFVIVYVLSVFVFMDFSLFFFSQIKKTPKKLTG